MKKQTVAAGCIAGVVAACSGVAVDATGRTLVDAGGALAGMGGALIDAAGSGALAGAGHVVAGIGGTLEQAGRAMVGGSGGELAVAGSGSVAAQETTGDGLPRAHWVLRDKDGTPVNADVTPGYPRAVARFAERAETCVWISHAGGHVVRLPYDLKTGALTPYVDCDQAAGFARYDNAHATDAALYSDAACETPAYSSWTAGQVLLLGTAAYDVSEAHPTAGTTVYRWIAGTSTCEAWPDTSSAAQFRVLTPIPAAAVKLLPNPPYSLELVY